MFPMNDERSCRLRVHGDDLDLAGTPAALRALAATLRAAPATHEVQILNATVVQQHTEGPLAVELRGSPSLHLQGTPAALAEVWSTLETVATATDADTEPDPHRHVGRLVVTGERNAALSDLGL
jgi:hypothetical protein